MLDTSDAADPSCSSLIRVSCVAHPAAPAAVITWQITCIQ